MRPSKLSSYVFLFFTFIFSESVVVAQNLETIGQGPALKISGGLSANQIFYAVSGIESRRDPYSYYLTGNVNFALYGWNVPLSFSLSNQNVSFQQPFNQYSLHPTYKWITGHIGYTSMNFSPYTLSGHLFNGVGIEATPGTKLKVSAMYGRLQKPVEPDTLIESNQPAFRRTGFGFKANYGDTRNFIELTTFRAADEMHSISRIPEEQNILPQENLVFSVGGGVSIFKKFLVKAEWANSAITRDTRGDKSHLSPYNNLGEIFTPRLTSNYYQAFKSSFSFEGVGYTLGVGYERIDPEYKTLGAYFFNNDLENITANGATALAGGKVNLSATVGSQRDNLDGSKISTMRRLVTAVNVGFVPNQNLNVAGSYSNFQTFTNIRSQFVDINQLTPYDNLDTLNFTQISQNAMVNGNYSLPGNKDKRKSISLNLSVMKADDTQGEVEQNSGSIFYNANGAYSVNFVPRNFTISTAFNYSLNEALDAKTKTVGPSVSISKSMLDKKLRISSSISANNTYTDKSLAGRVLSIRIQGGYSIKQKHNLNLNLVTLNRTIRKEEGLTDFTEFTGTLGYAYNFGN
jgi:hypothetical protein